MAIDWNIVVQIASPLVGYIQIMTKDEMKKLHIPSPNEADSVDVLFGFDLVKKRVQSRKMKFARPV